MPTFSVFVFGPGSASSGHRKSFQTAVTEKIDTTPMIGRDIGSTIDHSVRSGPAPSMTGAGTAGLNNPGGYTIVRGSGDTGW